MASPVRLNARESYEQERVVSWLLKVFEIHPKAFAAIPNGEKRDKGTAAKLQRMGVTPGAFDMIFFTSPPIGLEMKRTSGGHVDPDQVELHAFARSQGWDVIVAEGAETAKAELLRRPQFVALRGSAAAGRLISNRQAG